MEGSRFNSNVKNADTLFIRNRTEFYFMKKIGVYSLILSLGFFVAECNLTPASAQGGTRIQNDVVQKSVWHTAPREIQIIDERPVVKDFREAPQAGGSIELPSGPPGSLGSVGGNGAGALGGGSGASIPGSGLPLPGSGPGYVGSRAAIPGSGLALPGSGGYRASASGLPKSGFGGSNIPARGMGPGHLLPGVNHGGLGKMYQPTASAPRGVSVNPKPTSGNASTPVATYSGGYGQGTGPAFGGSSSQTSTAVRGSLLK
jgi:hypothetical protein